MIHTHHVYVSSLQVTHYTLGWYTPGCSSRCQAVTHCIHTNIEKHAHYTNAKQLMERQRLWLQILAGSGLDVRVCRVHEDKQRDVVCTQDWDFKCVCVRVYVWTCIECTCTFAKNRREKFGDKYRNLRGVRMSFPVLSRMYTYILTHTHTPTHTRTNVKHICKRVCSTATARSRSRTWLWSRSRTQWFWVVYDIHRLEQETRSMRASQLAQFFS